MDSKRWEPATIKQKYQDQPFLPKAYNVAIEKFINKDLKQVDFNIRRSGNGSGSGRVSSVRSDIIFHKWGKKGHIKKDCRSKGNGSSGKSPKKSTNKLPEWVTQNPVVSDTKYLITSNKTLNNKKYKCNYCDNSHGAWLFH